MKQAIGEIISLPRVLDMKDWQAYSVNEKNAILRRWWALGTNVNRTDSNYEEFLHLLKESPDVMWMVAIDSFTKGYGVEKLVQAMNNDELGEFLIRANMTFGMAHTQNDRETLERLKTKEVELLSKLVVSYNAIMDPSIKTDEDGDTKEYSAPDDTRRFDWDAYEDEDTKKFEEDDQKTGGKHI